MKILESGAINKEPNYNIQWEITHNCNYNCSYCHRPYRYSLQKENIDKCVNILDHLPIEKNSLYVLITGGEPTLHKHLQYILERTSNLNNLKKYALYTNLSCSEEYLNQIMKWVDTEKFDMFVSFHAEFAEYEAFQKRLDILNENNINYHIAVMLEPENYEKIIKFVNKYEKNNGNIDKLQFHPLANIEDIHYTKEMLELEKKNEHHDIKIKGKKDIFYKIEKEDGSIVYEEYYLSEMKKLPKEYHIFKYMNCYKYHHLRINPLGFISARCDERDHDNKRQLLIRKGDNYFCNSSPTKINDLYKKINKPVKCLKNCCFFRDDIRCILKTIEK